MEENVNGGSDKMVIKLICFWVRVVGIFLFVIGSNLWMMLLFFLDIVDEFVLIDDFVEE